MSEPSSSADAQLIARLRKTNTGLREVINTQAVEIEALTGQITATSAQVDALSAQVRAQVERIAELERRLGVDSSTSSRPPSSDPPYRKPERRSARRAAGRNPGKQPGEPGTTMPLVDNPDEVIFCDQLCCGLCGADLTGAPITRVERRQVTDVLPPPPPQVTEYQIRTRVCPGCAGTATGDAPATVPARAQYGPGSWPVPRTCCVPTTCPSGARPR